MADSSQEKTEKPTPHRLREARKKGQVPKSVELSAAIALLAGFGVVLMLAAWMPRKIADIYLAVERSIPHASASTVIGLLMESASLVAILSALPLVVVAVVGTLATAIQTGPVFSFEVVKPKLERLNPAEGLKKIFSMRTLVQFALMLFKALVIAGALLLILRLVVPDAIEVIYAGIGGALAIARRTVMLMVRWCGGLFLLLALLDLVYQRHQWLKDQKMSPQEVKREHREQEGDPMIKSLRRNLAQEPTPAELMQYVERASIVIAEPGGRAVALLYRASVARWPLVVVRGADEVAREILERGRNARVRLLFDPVLLERLYGSAIPGSPLNEALGAEVLAVLGRRG
ncbi:MAG: flagellar biosynthesis protein FlhB [Betaproteobacteria bacterium]